MRRTLLGAVAACAMALVIAVPAGAHDGEHVVVNPGESIQKAVDAAAPGTTIVVKRGSYAENVVITTDGIRLKGRGAELVPPATPAANACSFGEPSTDGICGIGQLTFPPDGPPVVTDPLDDVKVSGFRVTGFEGNGILFFGADDPVAKHNVLKDNGEYGIARFVSGGGEIVGNWASGSEEAGIYVGDSPDADVLIAHNAAVDNVLFGFFIRDAANGRVIANRASGNCVGAIVLNTGANIAGDWLFAGNKIHDNDRFCPGNEEEATPPLSGIGIALANAHDNRLFGNVIRDNVPSGEAAFSGGVAVVNAGIPGAEPASGNIVKGNVVLDNQPDLFWDGSGEGNVFERNLCRTSVPDGLCGRVKGHHGHGFGDEHDHGDEDHRDRGDKDHRGDDDHGDDDRDGGDDDWGDR